MVMTKHELYLKTIFCCMTCDGDIAEDEVSLLREQTLAQDEFKDLDVQNLLDIWIGKVNLSGSAFLKGFLDEISRQVLAEDEQMKIISLAIRTIEADKVIKYSEISFFKKIRFRLQISDEIILGQFPDKEDWLLPDIMVEEDPVWEDTQFADIKLA